jgi:hypothetical protein
MMTVSSSQAVPRVVQKICCNFYKTLIVLKVMPTITFGNIGTNAICGANNLLTNRIFSEIVPFPNNLPNFIG